ncbi:hypothetical protein [Arthrospiribacter ruber]|uniref:Uncharacterized protein n=1 Tax=Arthrospiribacter ruber TaxID=2487934 RepID=A0A951IZL5_9BACT|nr:hypothetical protein [Arthrospiribacter ruber]MBW3470070.1 hypothetical protein [Arthrospiribacter ruber]
MKKFIIGIGLLALTFVNLIPSFAICRDGNGQIEVENGRVFSANNLDGSCSDCDYTCSMPISSIP